MKDDSEAHAGRCLCGAVRYHLQGDALWVAHCHCQSCRRHTGTAMTTFVGVLKPQFRIVAGAARTFQSSTGVWRRFCPNCGTPLTYEAAYYDGRDVVDHAHRIRNFATERYGDRLSGADL